MLQRFLVLVILGFCAAAHAEYTGFTLEDARKFRAEWTIDNWDDGGDLMHYVFLNMSEFWNHSVILRGPTTRALPEALLEDVAGFMTTTAMGKLALRDYVNRSTINGAIVLHRGDVVFESYPRMRPYDKHFYMSVSKPLASTIVAILEDRELIDSNLNIANYLPVLHGSGWDGVRIRDVLDMSSGIDCLEFEDGAYEDPATCYYQYEAAMGMLQRTPATSPSVYEHLASLTSRRPAGEAFEYTSPNTFMLQWLAEEVSGQTYSELLATEIWQPMGAESDGIIAAPHLGVAYSSGGISSTLRDMARFALLFTPSGRDATSPVISDTYLDKIQNGGRPEIFNADHKNNPRTIDGEQPRHNSYQWDFVMSDGDFFKGGYGGQGIYVSPARDLVIAFFGTFDENQMSHEMTQIARQLAKSGLFDQ
ncbi:MAG: serine hydrolase [Woeseiaceae bacterium]|nr:serine hydrolase [Woeseiaceae bacterium]